MLSLSQAIYPVIFTLICGNQLREFVSSAFDHLACAGSCLSVSTQLFLPRNLGATQLSLESLPSVLLSRNLNRPLRRKPPSSQRDNPNCSCPVISQPSCSLPSVPLPRNLNRPLRRKPPIDGAVYTCRRPCPEFGKNLVRIRTP